MIAHADHRMIAAVFAPAGAVTVAFPVTRIAASVTVSLTATVAAQVVTTARMSVVLARSAALIFGAVQAFGARCLHRGSSFDLHRFNDRGFRFGPARLARCPAFAFGFARAAATALALVVVAGAWRALRGL